MRAGETNLHETGVGFFGDKVGMRPLIVQELEVSFILLCQGVVWGFLPLAPSGNHNFAACTFEHLAIILMEEA